MVRGVPPTGGKEQELKQEMPFTLGVDLHGSPVEWEPEKNQNTLTLTGRHGAGKTMLADSLMLQALEEQHAVVRFDYADRPLPSPLVCSADYADKDETLDVLDRTIAEVERRGAYHRTHDSEGPANPRPLMLVFEDLDRLMQSDDKCYLRAVGRRLDGIAREIHGLHVYMLFVSTEYPTGGPMDWMRILADSGHVHLGYSPIEPYVLPSNREYAVQLLTRMACHDFQLDPGQGFFEDRFGGMKPIQPVHKIQKGTDNA